MTLGILKMSSSLLVFIALSALGWLFLWFFLAPRARLRLEQARGPDIPKASARLIVLRSLSSLAMSMMLAPLAVALVYGYAQWRIDGAAGNPEKLQSIVAARALLERVLEPLSAIALEVWLIALVVVSTIWIIARSSSSRRSWTRALEARRQAHAARLSGMADAEVLAEASNADADAVARIDKTAASIEARNREEIRKMEEARLFSFESEQGGQHATSIAELRRLVEELEKQAASVEARAEDQLIEPVGSGEAEHSPATSSATG